MNEAEDISETAMSIIGSVAYGGPLPLRVTLSMQSELSAYECRVIDKAIRKRGLVLIREPDEDAVTICRAVS